MTVCIAAICSDNRIIGASDQMLTAGDIEFEPAQPKIWEMTTSIAVMYSGDAALQTEILRNVELNVSAQIRKTPTEWLNVSYVAGLYRTYYRAALRDRAEDAILHPLGLNLESFLAHQKEMDANLVSDISNRLSSYSFDSSVAAIIVGVDYDGAQPNTGAKTYPHIYVARNSELSCHDRVGFAAIGIGQFHAESYFMFEGHTKTERVPETLQRTYFAKKRAEVAPGVGARTDMFMIGPTTGSYFRIGSHVIEGLDAIYKDTQKALDEIAKKSKDQMNKFDEELAKKAKEAKEKSGETASTQSASQTSKD